METNNITLEDLRATCMARTIQYDQIATRLQRLENTIYGNGKEGLQIMVDRIEKRLDSISECLEGMPNMVEEKIESAILKLKPNLLDTDKVKLMIQGELKSAKQESENAPGSWAEFRKSWLFPVGMMIVSALVSALLTYLVVTP